MEKDSQIKINYPVVAVFIIWVLATALWWAFAFFQLPGPTPEWLLDARAVCFGETVTGLPDGQGWMTLFVPPLLLFISVVVAFYGELTSSLRSIFQTPLGKLCSFILISALTVEAGLIANVVIQRWPSERAPLESREKNLPEAYPQTKKPVPQFELIDQEKKAFSSHSFKNKKTILTFAFAHCDTICPLVIKTSIEAIKEFDKTNHQFVIITLDPWRDRPSRLKAAVKMWKSPENTHFLSGDVAMVEKTLKEFNIPYERDLKTGFVTHPALVYVVNGQGQIAYSFNNPSITWLKEALERI